MALPPPVSAQLCDASPLIVRNTSVWTSRGAIAHRDVVFRDGSGNFQGATSVEDAAAKVERFARAGVDWIAIHDAERFPAAVLGALAATARRTGVRLMAGGSTPAEITAALSIVPDTLDYIDRTVEPLYATPVLDLIRRQKTLVLVPTLGVRYRAHVYTRNPERLEQPGSFQFLTPPEHAFVLANAHKDLAGADTARALQVWPTLAGKLQPH